jgi:hypothetical protein
MTLDKAVAAKLAAQRGGEEAAELWKRLWAAYEQGGFERVEALLGELLEQPGHRAEGVEDA